MRGVDAFKVKHTPLPRYCRWRVLTITVVEKPIEAETGIIRAYRSGNVAITVGRATAESCLLP